MGSSSARLSPWYAARTEVTTSIDPALTVPPDDKDAWVETLVRLLTDQVFATEMKQKIKKFAEQTSWTNVGKMHLDAYAKLLEGK